MAVFGDSGGTAAVSSQFHVLFTPYESHNTKGETLGTNSLMKAAVPTFQKRPHPPPPLIQNKQKKETIYKGNSNHSGSTP